MPAGVEAGEHVEADGGRLGIQDAVEAVHHGVGVDRRAVVEGEARLELDRVRRAVASGS